MLSRPPERLSFHRFPTNDAWCRDHGAIFVTRPGADAPRLAVDFDYNAWGGKYPPFDLDRKVGRLMAEALGVPRFAQPGIVLEGGSIEVNGAGALLTTEQCLLNPNRNPQLDRRDIERILSDAFGVTEILWLGRRHRGRRHGRPHRRPHALLRAALGAHRDGARPPRQEPRAARGEPPPARRAAASAAARSRSSSCRCPSRSTSRRSACRRATRTSTSRTARCSCRCSAAPQDDAACAIIRGLLPGPARRADRLPRARRGSRHAPLPHAAGARAVARGHSDLRHASPMPSASECHYCGARPDFLIFHALTGA